MKCIIIEDQPPAQRILKKYIEDQGSLELLGVFGNAIEAISFLKDNHVDLMFLDIHLPKLSGIDFLKSLPDPPSVILTTAFADFALESYDLNVVDYLLKPFSFARFIKAVLKVEGKSVKTKIDSDNKTDHVFIKSGYDHIKVNLNDISLIKADNDYTEIVLGDKKYLSSESLKYWQDRAGRERMIRVHKSYLVNREKVKKVSSTVLALESGHEVPIGRTYKDEVLKKLISQGS